MTVPVQANLYSLGFGTRTSSPPVFQPFAPTSANVNYNLGQLWVNTANGNWYGLSSFSASNNAITANWVQLGSEAGALNTLTTQDSTVVSPTAGNINISGAANQLTTTGSGSTVTIGFVSAAIFPGSLEVTGLLTGDAGATLKTAGTAINIATDSDTAAVNIATVGARTTTIGDTTGASGTVQRVGTGNYSLDGVAGSTYTIGASTTTGTITIGGTAETGTITLGSSSGTNIVAIGAGAGATTVNVAGGAAANAVNLANGNGGVTIAAGGGTGGNTISINNGANASANVTNIAAGAAGANSTVNVLSGNATAGTQTLNLATGNAGYTVHIADNAAGTNVITLGNAAGATSLTLKAGTGGIVLTPTAGNISMAPGTLSTASASPTLSDRLGSITFTGFTTASGSSQVFTITNTNVLTTSAVFVTVTNLDASGNHAEMTLISCRLSANTLTIDTKNNGAGALGAGDNVLINFWVMS